jgi:hypothetical protein
MQKGQPVWQFNFGSNATKPFFHPVALPGGPVLTWDQPGDHPWHRALWFSWKFINGINYWEEDPKTGVSAGRTRWSEPQIETRRDFSARIHLPGFPCMGGELTFFRSARASRKPSGGVYCPTKGP